MALSNVGFLWYKIEHACTTDIKIEIDRENSVERVCKTASMKQVELLFQADSCNTYSPSIILSATPKHNMYKPTALSEVAKLRSIRFIGVLYLFSKDPWYMATTMFNARPDMPRVHITILNTLFLTRERQSNTL